MLILTYGIKISRTEVYASADVADAALPTMPDLEDIWNVEGIGITDSTCSDYEGSLQEFNETLK